MTTEEHRAYLEQTLRKSPEGSARRIWAAAQLAKLSPTATPCHPERSTAHLSPKRSGEGVRSRRISPNQEQTS